MLEIDYYTSIPRLRQAAQHLGKALAADSRLLVDRHVLEVLLDLRRGRDRSSIELENSRTILDYSIV